MNDIAPFLITKLFVNRRAHVISSEGILVVVVNVVVSDSDSIETLRRMISSKQESKEHNLQV